MIRNYLKTAFRNLALKAAFTDPVKNLRTE